LSASRTETGEFAIDESELHRVFQDAGNGAGTMLRDEPGNGDGMSPVHAALERVIAEKEARIADQAETIADLRRRLDSLTLLLPDRRPWWRRWLR
jgi:hypothetical protein